MKVSAHHPFRSAKAKTKYLALYDEMAKDWPVPSECRMVDTSYGQTFVRISGPVDAPPLVLLPGAGTCSLMWKPNIESLSKRHRSYAVDTLINTGCVGRSVYTRAIKNPNDAVGWLNELFSALELGDNIHLMGLSYGGWLTSQYALHSPDQLGKAVLLAPAATVLPTRLESSLRALLMLVPLRRFYRSFFFWIFNDLAQQNAQMVEGIIDEMIITMRCFKPANSAQMPLTVLKDEELRNIKVPTLFLVGENEVLYSAQKAVQRLNEVAPQLGTEVIPKAGHDLTVVQAAMVNQKALEFLAQS